MLWPFNHFKKPRIPSRGTIETIYGMIVAQAREPLFYQVLGVPDTVNGRFDMVLLHLWIVLRQLKSSNDSEGLSQALFDHFCSDMDANLREMGNSLRFNSERLLRDVAQIHGQLISRIDRVHENTRLPRSSGASTSTRRAPSGGDDELDVPEFMPRS